MDKGKNPRKRHKSTRVKKDFDPFTSVFDPRTSGLPSGLPLLWKLHIWPEADHMHAPEPEDVVTIYGCKTLRVVLERIASALDVFGIEGFGDEYMARQHQDGELCWRNPVRLLEVMLQEKGVDWEFSPTELHISGAVNKTLNLTEGDFKAPGRMPAAGQGRTKDHFVNYSGDITRLIPKHQLDSDLLNQRRRRKFERPEIFTQLENPGIPTSDFEQLSVSQDPSSPSIAPNLDQGNTDRPDLASEEQEEHATAAQVEQLEPPPVRQKYRRKRMFTGNSPESSE